MDKLFLNGPMTKVKLNVCYIERKLAIYLKILVKFIMVDAT